MDESMKQNMNNQKKIVEPLITVPKPRPNFHNQMHTHTQSKSNTNNCISTGTNLVPGTSKYAELLHEIEELNQHIRPSYAGYRGSAEKIRQGIIKARILVKECLIETERSARQ